MQEVQEQGPQTKETSPEVVLGRWSSPVMTSLSHSEGHEFESRPAHHHTRKPRGLTMPKQIYDVDRFLEMTEDAIECRVKRSKDEVKLKLRTARYLYTLVVEPQQADTILSSVKCEVVEVRPKSEQS